MLFPPRVKNIVQHPMIESWKPRLSLHLTDFLSSRLFHTTLLNTSGSAPFSPFQSTKRVLQVFQTSFLNGRENVFSHCYNKSEVFMLKWRSVCFSVWGCVLRRNWEQWLGASVPPIRPDLRRASRLAPWPSPPEPLPRQSQWQRAVANYRAVTELAFVDGFHSNQWKPPSKSRSWEAFIQVHVLLGNFLHSSWCCRESFGEGSGVEVWVRGPTAPQASASGPGSAGPFPGPRNWGGGKSLHFGLHCWLQRCLWSNPEWPTQRHATLKLVGKCGPGSFHL